jgi:hypothetical protein
MLAKPIDIGLIMPMTGLNSTEFQKYLQEHADKLIEARRAKFWALFNHFGLQLGPDFNPDDVKYMGQIWAALAMNLAVAHVPGFQEKPRDRKWPPEMVMLTLSIANWQKANKRQNSDLPACLEIVQGFNPELKRSGRKSEALRRAKTLRNRVSKLRQKLERERRAREAAEAKRPKPSAKIVQKSRGLDTFH